MLRGPTRSGCSRWRAAPRWPRCPGCKPREFYDLVVEVALIRPGPIQGGSVHPYIRRRNGLEESTYRTRCCENALEKTLGVPLFQEQLMQIAVDVAGFAAGEADELRRAMGSKRSTEKMERLRGRFYEGMAANGITGELADEIFDKMLAFANFGFPESHAMSFAYLVYASAWFKRYHPAAFCAALLNAQPMGFYSPQSLVADARRHGVAVAARTSTSARARGRCCSRDGAQHGRAGRPAGAGRGAHDRARRSPSGSRPSATRGGPYRDLADLARRVRLTVRAGRGAGHRRRVRRSSGWTGGRRCGRPGRSPRCGRTTCRAPPSASTRPRCPA